MDARDMTYALLRGYVLDSFEVDQTLRNLVEGFRRSRDLLRLATCTHLFNWQLHTVNDFRFLRQVEAFFKKNSCFTDRSVSAAKASEKFLDSEELCARTNRRLLEYLYCPDGQISERIKYARAYIRRALGSFESFTSQLPALVRVSAGATVFSNRSHSIPQMKLSRRPYCYGKSRQRLKDMAAQLGWTHIFPKECETNRLELVPKDWRSDRTIACEAEGSLALQLAFDTWTKRRLKRFGIDLRDQSRNQHAAWCGSLDGELSTIDFSSASDTVSYSVVHLLFPPDWAAFLDDTRAPAYRGKLGSGRYEKFSSMGNGSTFCLETLIFCSLCYASGSDRFLVYGDDVAIEYERLPWFLKLAEFFGFVVNYEKSFTSGPFRESCGKDYFRGRDITPVYLRDLTGTKPALCHLVNSLRRLCFVDSELGAVLDSIVNENHLPLVPVNECTTSGVWIDTVDASQLGFLRVRRMGGRFGPEVHAYKAYVPRTRHLDFSRDLRGYFLWFLQRANQVRVQMPYDSNYQTQPQTATQTSSATVFDHGYVRRWVTWHSPSKAARDLYLSDKVAV